MRGYLVLAVGIRDRAVRLRILLAFALLGRNCRVDLVFRIHVSKLPVRVALSPLGCILRSRRRVGAAAFWSISCPSSGSSNLASVGTASCAPPSTRFGRPERVRGTRAVSAIEYALLLGVVATAIIVGLTTFGQELTTFMDDMVQKFRDKTATIQ